MSDTSIKLIVWGAITLVSIVIAFICYRWLSNVARFENRKKEIALGMVVCVLAISSLMFMPVLFSRIDLHQTGRELFDQIQFAEMDAEDNGSKLDIAPFVRPFAHVLAALSYKWISILIIVIPSIISLLIILFVAQIILKIREPKKNEGEEDNRKHLFEYKSEVLAKLNKDSQR